MILIYTDSQLLDLEWITRLKFNQPFNITHSFVEYNNTSADYKIAFTAHRLHCDYDLDCTAYKNFEDKIRQLSDISNLVFTFESELHHYHWSIWSFCHRNNVYWVMPGTVNDRPDMKQNLIHWADFFKLTRGLYRALPNKLNELQPYDIKPLMFDALLGCPKPHRSFIANAVVNNNLQDQFIMTYGGKWNNNQFYAKDYFIWEPGCEPVQKIIGTADFVRYHGHEVPLSQVIPIDVYNRTAYSIIAETDHDNTLSFYSEKTAKALVGRRLFVAFTGYRFLQNLRDLGFETFGSVIDEEYDVTKHDGDRYTKAFEQVKYLCSQNQRMILDKIRPVLEHNHNLIMTRDWTGYAADYIQQHVNCVLANDCEPTLPNVDVHDPQDGNYHF